MNGFARNCVDRSISTGKKRRSNVDGSRLASRKRHRPCLSLGPDDTSPHIAARAIPTSPSGQLPGSEIPQVAPKLPSIWNCGCVFERFGSVLSRNCRASVKERDRCRTSAPKVALLGFVPAGAAVAARLERDLAASAIFVVVSGKLLCPGYGAHRGDVCRCSSLRSSRSTFHSSNSPHELPQWRSVSSHKQLQKTRASRLRTLLHRASIYMTFPVN